MKNLTDDHNWEGTAESLAVRAKEWLTAKESVTHPLNLMSAWLGIMIRGMNFLWKEKAKKPLDLSIN